MMLEVVTSKELLDGANIEVSGSDALVQCAVDKKVLESDKAITGVTKWRSFSRQQVRVSPAGVTHSDTTDHGVLPICSL